MTNVVLAVFLIDDLFLNACINFSEINLRRHISCENCLERVNGGFDPTTNQVNKTFYFILPEGVCIMCCKFIIIIIIIDNVCIALFSGVPKLTALYILQHFLSFTNIIHIFMTTNNV